MGWSAGNSVGAKSFNSHLCKDQERADGTIGRSTVTKGRHGGGKESRVVSKDRERCRQEGFQVHNITRDEEKGCINQGDVVAS